MAFFGEKTHQHKTPTHLCLFDLHYAVRSASTLKQTCKIKQELTAQLSLFSACALDNETRQRKKKSPAIKVFYLFSSQGKSINIPVVFSQTHVISKQHSYRHCDFKNLPGSCIKYTLAIKFSGQKRGKGRCMGRKALHLLLVPSKSAISRSLNKEWCTERKLLQMNALEKSF